MNFIKLNFEIDKIIYQILKLCLKDFSIQTLTTQDIEDSSDEGDEVGIQHATDTMTTLVNEPLQVVPDIVPE